VKFVLQSPRKKNYVARVPLLELLQYVAISVLGEKFVWHITQLVLARDDNFYLSQQLVTVMDTFLLISLLSN